MVDMEKLIGRINELANKSKVEELSKEEKEEQAELREEYLKIFRGNFRRKLENIEIVRVDDEDENLKN